MYVPTGRLCKKFHFSKKQLSKCITCLKFDHYYHKTTRCDYARLIGLTYLIFPLLIIGYILSKIQLSPRNCDKLFDFLEDYPKLFVFISYLFWGLCFPLWLFYWISHHLQLISSGNRIFASTNILSLWIDNRPFISRWSVDRGPYDDFFRRHKSTLRFYQIVSSFCLLIGLPTMLMLWVSEKRRYSACRLCLSMCMALMEQQQQLQHQQQLSIVTVIVHTIQYTLLVELVYCLYYTIFIL